MTANEYIKQEAAAIKEQSGCYIPPYRLAALTDIANKVMKTITGGTFCMSYRECRMVLRIVAGAIDAAAGEEENDA